MASWGSASTAFQTALSVLLLCLLSTRAHAWGIVQFHGSRNCSSDAVSFARLCLSGECCTALSYSPADQTQSAIGAIGFCANGRVTGKLYSAYGNARPVAARSVSCVIADCSGPAKSTFDVEELTSDEIQSASCSPVGAYDSGMGDCSGGAKLLFSWPCIVCLLVFVF